MVAEPRSYVIPSHPSRLHESKVIVNFGNDQLKEQKEEAEARRCWIWKRSSLLALLQERERKKNVVKYIYRESLWTDTKTKKEGYGGSQLNHIRRQNSIFLVFNLFFPKKPKTLVAQWHCHLQSVCASGKFLRVTLEIAVRSVRTVWKISRSSRYFPDGPESFRIGQIFSG